MQYVHQIWAARAQEEERARLRGRWRPQEVLGGNEVVRSAMELSDAGIRFKKSRSASLDDISFTGGVLSLPPIMVDDTTESTFLNLIAFERFHVDFAGGNEVTSYIFFMSKIIEIDEDVSLAGRRDHQECPRQRLRRSQTLQFPL
ncbi:hypothetical protein RHGRI_033283 [Rhododendron griersonianum]|uniref:Uncharacterized protein n=1 Tax=Rhododendron griersonianum TaxID=479676 RepID=A0AAV6I1U6_9ERIC|nr:hypothetical protein RHGRI_033283 [Rhododendron griersonianum]